jgi:hypothetical protein
MRPKRAVLPCQIVQAFDFAAAASYSQEIRVNFGKTFVLMNKGIGEPIRKRDIRTA